MVIMSYRKSPHDTFNDMKIVSILQELPESLQFFETFSFIIQPLDKPLFFLTKD